MQNWISQHEEIVYTTIMFLLLCISLLSHTGCFKADVAVQNPKVIEHFDHACVMKCPCDIGIDSDSWSIVQVPK